MRRQSRHQQHILQWVLVTGILTYCSSFQSPLSSFSTGCKGLTLPATQTHDARVSSRCGGRHLLHTRDNYFRHVSSYTLAMSSASPSSASSSGSAANVKLPIPYLPRSTIYLHNQETKTSIYLVGCLHGAPTSGADVLTVLEGTRPEAVVLELCDSRFKSLKKEMLLQEQALKGKPPDKREVAKKTLHSWWKQVQVTRQKKGIGQAIFAGGLSFAYVLQKLSSFDPGLEFKEAVRFVSLNGGDLEAGVEDDAGVNVRREGSGSGDDSQDGINSRTKLILGDQDVNTTLRRLGGKGRTDEKSGQPASDADHHPDKHSSSDGLSGIFATQAKDAGVGPLEVAKVLWDSVLTLGTALGYGPRLRGPWPASVNLLEVLFKQPQVLKDLAGLLAPFSIVVLTISEIIELMTQALTHTGAFQTVAVASSSSGVSSSTAVATDPLSTSSLFATTAATGQGVIDNAVATTASAWTSWLLSLTSASSSSLPVTSFAVESSLTSSSSTSTLTSISLPNVGDVMSLTVDCIDAIVITASLYFSLRFIKYVIKERDRVLATSIMEAAQEYKGGTVVAVLGLLHCNGVAQLLREEGVVP